MFFVFLHRQTEENIFVDCLIYARCRWRKGQKNVFFVRSFEGEGDDDKIRSKLALVSVKRRENVISVER